MEFLAGNPAVAKIARSCRGRQRLHPLRGEKASCTTEKGTGICGNGGSGTSGRPNFAHRRASAERFVTPISVMSVQTYCMLDLGLGGSDAM